ncbi:3-deoxy-D-manno-octulosonic acid transferase [Weeksellaceae bacterium KMM 9724]|uniref:3-deoxy-D-manno-octulosonic acid transferase n=1 Tax=Profundicola chukchiensis TaxID=2961959 RepID=UPI00244000A8|nr:glycosyltransferase N-terminal domain-containing protein [Profundicola chukchiensis]MDG4949592.1 3-deoxy-D-manno-octulosonic acid transferase [Profundicola chukchiensis]
MSFLYQFFIQLYVFGFRVFALFNSKARKGLDGRKNWEDNLKKAIDPASDWICMHCSSLGEFEQGRPVFEALKKQFPNHKLALSFFSPSGYEIRKNYDLADVVFYLPFDTPNNAKKLAQILQPKYWILVKYDYWYNHLREQHKMGTKTIVVSSIFRENQVYFKPHGAWMSENLKKYITHFFVQDETSEKLLRSIGINQVSVAGDTRYDRVKSIAAETNKLDWVEQFKSDKKLIVIGSSWGDDEQLWVEYLNKYQQEDWKVIFVPHEIKTPNILKLKTDLNATSVLYSEITPNIDLANQDVIIVDAIGFLSKIYASADLAYVGGGFNKSGVHNTLEPAVFKIPVVIGPNYQKFNEVKVMKSQAIVYPIKNYAEFEKVLLDLTQHQEKRLEIAKAAQDLFENQQSATEAILAYLAKE